MTSFDAISNNYPQAKSVNTPIAAQNPISSPPVNNMAQPKSFSAAEVSAAVLATALVATTIGGAVLHGKYKGAIKKTSELEKQVSSAVDGEKEAKAVKKTLENTLNASQSENQRLGTKVNDLEQELAGSQSQANKLEQENQQLGTKVNDLEQELAGSQSQANNLEQENQQLSQKVGDLKTQLEGSQLEREKLEARLKELLSEAGSDDSESTAILQEMRARFDGAKLDYDSQNPHIIKRNPRVFDDAVELPATSGTQNRADMQVLNIPQVSGGKFEFELPSRDAKITKCESIDFEPELNVKTTVSEGYADSLHWDNDKIVRDILQNFYDGHGQTLDGVAFKIVPTKDGKYKIRIEGKSTYTPDKAVIIGESTKRNDPNAAGNNGEGLKVTTLKLLKDLGAENVAFASDNWRVNYSLQRSNFGGKKVLTYSLEKPSEVYDGNYMEFETDSLDLVNTFRNSINRFYHSGNEHFKCPDHENALFGVKLLNKGEKGGIYIAGQRFEYDGDYDGVKELVLFIKEKPPFKILDPSRDRISLNSTDFNNLVKWLMDDKNITKEERLNLFKAFESRWASYSDSQANDFLEGMLNAEHRKRWGSTTLHVQFPDNYVASTPFCDSSIIATLEKNGYTICKSGFSDLGMKTVAEVYGEARKHTPIQPNAAQERRILILKEAIKKLSVAMKKHGFSDSEIDAHIHLFDRKSAKERLHSNALAEAIIDNGESKGFWIDCSYIQESQFGHVLETALHELSHKVGGDSSDVFSYKLTDVNAEVIDELMKNPQTRKEFQALAKLWDEAI